MGLLTARAAAERLGVGYSTLKRWVRSGRVRTTRTEGGHHRVAESEIDRLLAEGVTSIAISFLHAYADGAHERRAAEIVRERAPDIPVTLSGRISRQLSIPLGGGGRTIRAMTTNGSVQITRR